MTWKQVHTKQSLFSNPAGSRAARAKDTNQDPKYFGNVLNSKTRPFAINAPSKKRKFTVIDSRLA